jgi:cytochrome c-type biogenesis protein
MAVVTLPLLAVLAGVISFSSPCCLPLIPGYLSYVSGLPIADLGEREARAATVRAAAGFVAGFSFVFTGLGVAAGLAGSLVVAQLPWVLRVCGVFIVGMGLAMAGVLRVPVLYRERRFDLARAASGSPRTAVAMGGVFAFGWAPCIGPVLATILATAAASGTAAWGAVLLAFYSVVLGVPFVALAIGFQRARGTMRWLRRHGRGVERAGGAMLVAVGVLFISGLWPTFFTPLQRWFAQWGWPPL